MTARLRSGGGAEPELVKSLSSEEEGFFTGGPSINNKAGGLSDEDHTPLLPRLQTSGTAHDAHHPQRRQLVTRRLLPSMDDEDGDSKKRKRGFCQTWCDMWFLLSQTKVGCIILNALLFGGGLLIIALTVFGGIMDCPELNGAVVYLFLVATLSITLGCLCCGYHWVKDNHDLPFGIFCVAYCVLFLYICITISGTVVVFTRIYPIGPDQPPPDMVNGTSVNVLSHCKMVELPFGVLIVSYCVAVMILCIAYCACLLALGARHVDD